MINCYFAEEEILENDLYFLCYMIERVARKIHQPNAYVVNKIGRESLVHLISVANVLHAENPVSVEDEWIDEYRLQTGIYDVSNVDKNLVSIIPSPTQMGKVYQRLIVSTLQENEDYVDGIIRVYNNSLCTTLDNYNCSAYYEPSYIITRAYFAGGF